MFLQGDNQIAFSVDGTEVLVIGAAGLQFDDGTAALPSITFDADLNTGIYRVATDRLGFTTAGVAAWEIDATGDLTGVLTTAVILAPIGTTLLPSHSFTGDPDTGMSAATADTLILSAAGVQQLILSAALFTVNEDSADVDTRFEGANNVNLFVLDGGLDSVSHGAAVTAGAFLTLSGYAQSRAHVTSVGSATHIPAGTLTDSGDASLAIGAAHFIGIPTWGGTGTYTDAATLYIQGASAAGTKTQTRAYALFVDAGRCRFDGGAMAGAGRLQELLTVTAAGTVQNYTLLVAGIVGGIVTQDSTVGGGTVTTDTAANIIAGSGGNGALQIDGESITCRYINIGGQTLTFAGGDSVTVSDTGNVILTNESATLIFVRTAATTVTLHIV
jgi:hypothetical protein